MSQQSPASQHRASQPASSASTQPASKPKPADSRPTTAAQAANVVAASAEPANTSLEPVVGARRFARRRPEKQKQKQNERTTQPNRQHNRKGKTTNSKQQTNARNNEDGTKGKREVGEEVRRGSRLRPAGPNQHPPHPRMANEKDAGQAPDNPPEGYIFPGRGRERPVGKRQAPRWSGGSPTR